MPQSNDVQVSVLMICYNHERYLSQAIESALSQQTSFPFEILIYDDKSTDSSRVLISRYQEQHSDIIKCIFPSENQFSKGEVTLVRLSDCVKELGHNLLVVLFVVH